MEFIQSLQALITFAVSLSGLLLVVIFVLLLRSEVYREQIRIEPISVPNALAAQGYTPVVVAQRIRDAIDQIRQEAATAMKMPETDLPGETPEVVVPAVGISVETMAAALRRYFGIGRLHEVTGEVTAAPDGSVSMRIRLDSDRHLIFDSASEAAPRDLNELIESAAFRVVDGTKPYILASRQYQFDPQSAYDMAEDIIRRLPASDDNVAWATSLEGNILLGQGNLKAAEQKYRAAILLNPKVAVAHVNLGLVLRAEHKHEEAASEYRTAIQLDPKDAAPHGNLGNVLRAEGKREEAASEYRAAIQLDPKNAEAHYNLGLLLVEQARGDTTKPDAIRDLTEACENMQVDAHLAPADPDYPKAMQEIDALLADGGHCPPR